MKVNKNLLQLKAYYFFFNASAAPIAPFLVVIAKSIGYSTTAIGTLFTIIPLLTLVTKPALGSLADKFSLHKTLFLCLIASYSICFFSLQWISKASVESSVVLQCETNTTFTVPVRSGDACSNDWIQFQTNSSFTCEMYCRGDWPSQYGDDNKQGVNGLSLMIGQLKYSASQMQDDLVVDVVSLTDRNGTAINTSCPVLSKVVCDLRCSNLQLQKLINKPAINEEDAPKFFQFWIFAIVAVVGRLSTTNAMTIGDTMCLGLLGDRPEDYGRQRMFGAGGWGLIAMLSGLITDWYSQGKDTTDYTLCFYISLTFCVANLINGFNLKYQSEEKSVSVFSNVKKALIRDPHFILFWVTSIFCGAYSGLVWNFLFVYVEEIAKEDTCSGSNWLKTLEGIILFVHTFAGEIPFFLLSGWMIRRLGHIHCVSLVTFCFGLRFCLFYFIPNPWWLLPIEVLNGITYAIFNVTSATYANKIAPPGTQATVQGIVAGSFEGLGISLGTFFGGVLVDRLGGRLCFLMAGISSFILCFIYTVLQFSLSYCCSPKTLKAAD
ncbi:hypothetical protein GE061_015190 [Apolygus lucorum]|uniref:Major facilitator superfamily (MFS) profile domain-containing protein n=1 Tax=Apolygus lucorum TaxID=248454 RepID=A0A8S9XKD7_APOLU|nr:hypothetical protein GE061_015190 [Apolygus lucorum]